MTFVSLRQKKEINMKRIVLAFVFVVGSLALGVQNVMARTYSQAPGPTFGNWTCDAAMQTYCSSLQTTCGYRPFQEGTETFYVPSCAAPVYPAPAPLPAGSACFALPNHNVCQSGYACQMPAASGGIQPVGSCQPVTNP